MVEYSSELRTWVEQHWSKLDLSSFAAQNSSGRLTDEAPQWLPLSGDAGFRRYFRLPGAPSLLAVYAPPSTEDMTAFINIAEQLRVSGVLVPAIAAYDIKRGFMLIEDLGASLLSDKLSADTVDDFYQASMQSLHKIQRASIDAHVFPSYTKQKLLAEMNLFKDWFVTELLGKQISQIDLAMLDDWFLQLIDSAVEQPQVVVHRDYHSRNLIYREFGLPGVIDFQDAVVGPITYDLVSLLRDCYVQWSDDKVKRWAASYLDQSKQDGIMLDVTVQQFMRWFDLMGLQRHIKVLGIFARLSLRDKKHGYLNDLPLVVDYTLRVSRRYKEADVFVNWFEGELIPAIEQQSWYKAPPEAQL